MLDIKKELNSISKRLDVSEIKDIDYFPRYIEVEAYDGCNFDCIMCPLGKSIYKGGGGITIELFDKIVSEISNYKEWINLVCLSRNGEPLLNKNIATMVKKLKDAGIKRVNFLSFTGIRACPISTNRCIVLSIALASFSMKGSTESNN